jgi:Papain-like cysteine protease AvrRpt2
VVDIKSNVATKIKRSDVDSSKLPAHDIIVVPAGTVLSGDTIAGTGKSFGLKFSKAYGEILAGDTWYYHGPHFEVVGVISAGVLKATPATSDEIVLDVKYFSQMDNEEWDGADPNCQCAPTSNCCALFHLKPSLYSLVGEGQEPEDIYKERFESLGYASSDRGNHDCHTATLKSFGIESVWGTTYTDADITKSLQKKVPIVVGFCYKEAGHISVVVGRTKNGYKVHDVYGAREGSSDFYTIINSYDTFETHGAYEDYSWAILEEVLFSQDGTRSGAWGRMVISIDGVATGL